MPSELLPFLGCFGFLFFLIPTIVCIVLATRLSELRKQVAKLELRLTDVARELAQYAQRARTPEPAAHVQAAPPVAKPASAPLPVSPPVVKPVPPSIAPVFHAVPPAPTVTTAGSGTAGKLLEKLTEVRQSTPLSPPPAAVAPPVMRSPFIAPATPHVAPPVIPAPIPTPPASVTPIHAPPSAAVPVPNVPPPVSMPPAPAAPSIAAPNAAATVASVTTPTPPPPVPMPVQKLPPVPPVVPPMPVAPLPVPRPNVKRRGADFDLIAGFIVVGAISLALAIIFLVKMGIDNGYFGPLQRDWAAVIAALALLGVGQWRRRFEGFWSQGATAAGIVALFATIFAATSVHHFIDPLTGFVFLAVATAGAVALSLQDWSGATGEASGSKGGILIATLGLIGGFITPILVNSGHENVPGLFGYLILLHMGLIASTRIRGWSILAAASVVFSSLWLILWVLFKWDPVLHPNDGPVFGLFVLVAVGSLVISTFSQPERWRGGRSGLAAMALTWLAVGLALLACCLLLGKSHYDNLQWAFFAMLVAGAFVLARLRSMYEGMAWLG
ncbi:MAG: DUF2339 domain-containing protein [Phycisphaerae bacterium]